MEGDMASARNAAETARRAEEARKAEEARLKAADAPLVRLAMGPFRDPARLAPAIPFAQAKGMLPMPAAGTIAKPFGAADGYGGAEKGISIAVRPRAVVASPTDGTIKFSGPYRSWGHLLIIDAGGGYYVILAGMEKVNVDIRQFVLAGEPVGEMGDANVRTAAAIALGATHPLLYVEFRKDGASIDPAPWWAKPEQEKVRG
jgi:septal ring factor EnvC (AmiA/AmiB activator)